MAKQKKKRSRKPSDSKEPFDIYKDPEFKTLVEEYIRLTFELYPDGKTPQGGCPH